jgi:type VI secretion system secreted protein VgrG
MLLDDTMTPFALTAGPYAAGRLRVLSFRGREASSRPFRFDVAIAVGDTDAQDLESQLLGRPAVLSMQVPDGEPRNVCGIVAAVAAQDAFEQDQHAFHLRLVPRLWLLGKRKTSRVFQNETVPEIVGKVLDAARVPYRAALIGRYLVRTHCVQYQETDLAFVTRLLAEEGIFYFFEHDTEETVVLCDSACCYEPIAGEPRLTYRYEQGGEGLVPAEHHVGRFARRRTIKTGAVLHRDYDFRRPMLDLRAEAKPSSLSGAADGDTLPFEAEELRDYDHHGEDEQPYVDASTARVRLEQHRRRALAAEGASACRRLVPGFRFELVDHRMDALDSSYVVAHVEHKGRAPEVARGSEPVYANAFACVLAGVPLRPRRPERVLRQVAETALVVGPEGEEIHTDAHGRVKVQFPWDLEGEKNEHSSCWVRVAQGWAGAGWGLQLIPRIGMEVVVTFVGGDVDRPLVIGCVPNAANAPAFALPANRTRSGIRTRTTPSGDGFNELSFEDRKGGEQVYLHAERDLDVVVERNHTRLVKSDETVTIQHDRREVVLGDQTSRVHGRCVEAVLGSRASAVEGDSREVVTGHAELRVSQDLTTRVGGRDHREVIGTSDFVAKDDVNVRVRGCHTTLVGTREENRSYVLHVEGLTQLTGSGITEIRSEKALVLTCGRSSLRITDGKIEIVSPAVSTTGEGGGLSIGEGTVRIRAKKDARIQAERVVLTTPDASVSLAKDAQIDGHRVLLNSPGSAIDPPPAKPVKPTTIALVDQRGKPMAHRRYMVTLADGSEVSGILDKNGKAEVEIEGAGTIAFPGLRGVKAA